MTWNERLVHYRRLTARAKEAAETGWFRAANDRYNREHAALDALDALGAAAPGTAGDSYS